MRNGEEVRKTKEVKQYYYSNIDKLRELYSVEWLCQLFEVSRSGYYKWKKVVAGITVI